MMELLTLKQYLLFETLVKAVNEPLVPALPKNGLPYRVDTAVSGYKVGCALFQTLPEGERQPIDYWSQSLTQSERNYSVTKKEVLAVVFALFMLRPYLMMEHISVHTDHASWRWLLSISDPSGRLMRCLMRSSEFNSMCSTRKGTKTARKTPFLDFERALRQLRIPTLPSCIPYMM